MYTERVFLQMVIILHELVLFIFRVIISSKLAENFPGKNTNFRFLWPIYHLYFTFS